MNETANDKTENSTGTSEATKDQEKTEATNKAPDIMYPSMKEGDSKTTDEDKKSDEGEKSKDEEAGDKDEGEKSKDEDKKSDEEKSKDDKDEDEKTEPYKIELPDDLKVDKKLVGELEAFVNTHGVPKEEATEFAKEIVGMQEASFQAMLDDWTKQTKNDGEIGGAKYDESVAFAKKAVERFGGPQGKSALDETGLGSHPEIVRMMTKIGKAMSDDHLNTGGNEKPEKRSGVASIYSTMEET